MGPYKTQYLLLIIALCSTRALSQEYPSRPIRIIISEPGGGTDFTARTLAQGISPTLGQQVIVDNRASALTAAQTVVQAPPDGYAILIISGGFWVGPLLRKVSYHPIKDVSPISLLVNTPNILVVHPSVPAHSVKELIELAKARPGALNYGTGGVGSSSHLSAELFKAMADVNIVRVNYKGAGPALRDLLGGQVQMMFAVAASVTPAIKSGKLRSLAVANARPSVLVPGVPTVAESGLPGYESGGATAMFVPTKTPMPIVNRLNQETVRFLNIAEVREKFIQVGTEIVASTPEQLAATMKSEIARMSKVIKDAGIRLD